MECDALKDLVETLRQRAEGAEKRCIDLYNELERKREVFRNAARRAMVKRKDSERALRAEIKGLEKKCAKLTRENSFVKHRSCRSKVKYNESVARAWAASRGQRAYRCKYCNGWHLASK